MSLCSWAYNISWEETKNFAEVVALFSAALFFLYKFRSGYLIVNLSLKVTCTRISSKLTNKNYLVINVHLSKGDRGSLVLYDAQLRLDCEGEKKTISLDGIERLSDEGRKIKWVTSTSYPYLNITPNEEAVFSHYCEIEADKPYRVEVVILGRKALSFKTGQWRASCVSLPD